MYTQTHPRQILGITWCWFMYCRQWYVVSEYGNTCGRRDDSL